MNTYSPIVGYNTTIIYPQEIVTSFFTTPPSDILHHYVEIHIITWEASNTEGKV